MRSGNKASDQCTVKVALLWKSLPAVFHAFTTIVCVPAASAAEPLMVPLGKTQPVCRQYKLSWQRSCVVPPLAAAEMATGEETVDPAAGAQIRTPALVGALHAVVLPTVKFTMV